MLVLYIHGIHTVIIVPADGLAPDGARPSAGTMLTSQSQTIFYKLFMAYNISRDVLLNIQKNNWDKVSPCNPRKI